MPEWLIVVLCVVGYLALTQWILPWLGVPT
jgi:hypothetical protein